VSPHRPTHTTMHTPPSGPRLTTIKREPRLHTRPASIDEGHARAQRALARPQAGISAALPRLQSGHLPVRARASVKRALADRRMFSPHPAAADARSAALPPGCNLRHPSAARLPPHPRKACSVRPSRTVGALRTGLGLDTAQETLDPNVLCSYRATVAAPRGNGSMSTSNRRPGLHRSATLHHREPRRSKALPPDGGRYEESVHVANPSDATRWPHTRRRCLDSMSSQGEHRSRFLGPVPSGWPL